MERRWRNMEHEWLGLNCWNPQKVFKGPLKYLSREMNKKPPHNQNTRQLPARAGAGEVEVVVVGLDMFWASVATELEQVRFTKSFITKSLSASLWGPCWGSGLSKNKMRKKEVKCICCRAAANYKCVKRNILYMTRDSFRGASIQLQAWVHICLIFYACILFRITLQYLVHACEWVNVEVSDFSKYMPLTSLTFTYIVKKNATKMYIFMILLMTLKCFI